LFGKFCAIPSALQDCNDVWKGAVWVVHLKASHGAASSKATPTIIRSSIIVIDHSIIDHSSFPHPLGIFILLSQNSPLSLRPQNMTPKLSSFVFANFLSADF
jgi:hypothetical protein